MNYNSVLSFVFTVKPRIKKYYFMCISKTESYFHLLTVLSEHTKFCCKSFMFAHIYGTGEGVLKAY